MLARAPSPPWRTTITVISDDRRRTDNAVLDHLLLFQGPRDALRAFPSTAMPSPMLQLALIAMLTIVTRELTQHPVEAI